MRVDAWEVCRELRECAAAAWAVSRVCGAECVRDAGPCGLWGVGGVGGGVGVVELVGRVAETVGRVSSLVARALGGVACVPVPAAAPASAGAVAGTGAGGVMICGVGVVDVGAVAGHVSCGGVVSCGGGVVQCVDVSGVSLRRDELVGVVRGVVCGGSGACVVRAHDVVSGWDVGGVVSMLGRACGAGVGRVDLGVVDVSVVPRGVCGPVWGDVRGVCGGGVVGVRGWCRVVGSGSRVSVVGRGVGGVAGECGGGKPWCGGGVGWPVGRWRGLEDVSVVGVCDGSRCGEVRVGVVWPCVVGGGRVCVGRVGVTVWPVDGSEGGVSAWRGVSEAEAAAAGQADGDWDGVVSVCVGGGGLAGGRWYCAVGGVCVDGIGWVWSGSGRVFVCGARVPRVRVDVCDVSRAPPVYDVVVEDDGCGGGGGGVDVIVVGSDGRERVVGVELVWVAVCVLTGLCVIVGELRSLGRVVGCGAVGLALLACVLGVVCWICGARAWLMCRVSSTPCLK